MPCYHPILAYRGRRTNPETGKRPLVFNPTDGFTDLTEKLPCGKCIGCRLEKARQWQVRILHEAQLHEKNCFVTLTYSPLTLPPGGTLVKRDLQLFMKNLRYKMGEGIKYYAVGEYGPKMDRPHYHLCLFGVDFDDKTMWKYKPRLDKCLYRSKTLESIWQKGYSSCGSLTPDSAGYVARYIQKKITGKMAEKHYEGKLPEFALMSRGGRQGRGLAYEWFAKYSTDVYPKDFTTIKGRKHRPPRYYDKLYEDAQPEIMKEIKISRILYQKEHEISLRRLKAKEKYATSMANRNLKRNYEGGSDDNWDL